LLWSMECKQVTDIGARTAVELLHRELQDGDGERYGGARDKSFASLMMDIVRLEIASSSNADSSYGAELDHLVRNLDNMTERRVVPGRTFTPSTLHGRDGLQTSLLSMLLARVSGTDDALLKRINDLAENEAALPTGDRSLRDLLLGLERFTKIIEIPL